MDFETIRFNFMWNRYIARANRRRSSWPSFWVFFAPFIIGLASGVASLIISNVNLHRSEQIVISKTIQLPPSATLSIIVVTPQEAKKNRRHAPAGVSYPAAVVTFRMPRVLEVGDSGVVSASEVPDEQTPVQLHGPCCDVFPGRPEAGENYRWLITARHSGASLQFLVGPPRMNPTVVDGVTEVRPTVPVIGPVSQALTDAAFTFRAWLARLRFHNDEITVGWVGVLFTVLGAISGLVRFVLSQFPTVRRTVYIPSADNPIMREFVEDARIASAARASQAMKSFTGLPFP